VKKKQKLDEEKHIKMEQACDKELKKVKVNEKDKGMSVYEEVGVEKKKLDDPFMESSDTTNVNNQQADPPANTKKTEKEKLLAFLNS